MGKRFEDRPYSDFSVWDEIAVACPRCGKEGAVRLNRERSRAAFRCGSCGFREEAPPNRLVPVTARCPATGRYFRVIVPGETLRGPKKRVRCPCCGEWVVGEAAREGPESLVLGEVRQGRDPFFHYPLYFQGTFRGKQVWALNREHLGYLIDYLSADLRSVSAGFRERYGTMRSQSDRLPAFLKAAKNREGIVRLLARLQAK